MIQKLIFGFTNRTQEYKTKNETKQQTSFKTVGW
jgi:hypothetical protein